MVTKVIVVRKSLGRMAVRVQISLRAQITEKTMISTNEAKARIIERLVITTQKDLIMWNRAPAMEPRKGVVDPDVNRRCYKLRHTNWGFYLVYNVEDEKDLFMFVVRTFIERRVIIYINQDDVTFGKLKELLDSIKEQYQDHYTEDYQTKLLLRDLQASWS